MQRNIILLLRGVMIFLDSLTNVLIANLRRCSLSYTPKRRIHSLYVNIIKLHCETLETGDFTQTQYISFSISWLIWNVTSAQNADHFIAKLIQLIGRSIRKKARKTSRDQSTVNFL